MSRLASQLIGWQIDLYGSREWLERGADISLLVEDEVDSYETADFPLSELSLTPETLEALGVAGYNSFLDIIDLDRADFLSVDGVTEEAAAHLLTLIEDLTVIDSESARAAESADGRERRTGLMRVRELAVDLRVNADVLLEFLRESGVRVGHPEAPIRDAGRGPDPHTPGARAEGWSRDSRRCDVGRGRVSQAGQPPPPVCVAGPLGGRRPTSSLWWLRVTHTRRSMRVHRRWTPPPGRRAADTAATAPAAEDIASVDGTAPEEAATRAEMDATSETGPSAEAQPAADTGRARRDSGSGRGGGFREAAGGGSGLPLFGGARCGGERRRNLGRHDGSTRRGSTAILPGVGGTRSRRGKLRLRTFPRLLPRVSRSSRPERERSRLLSGMGVSGGVARGRKQTGTGGECRSGWQGAYSGRGLHVGWPQEAGQEEGAAGAGVRTTPRRSRTSSA